MKNEFTACLFCDNLVDVDYSVCELCCDRATNGVVGDYSQSMGYIDESYGSEYDAYEYDIYGGEYCEM